MRQKSYAAQFKALDDSKGTFEAIVAVFGNVDLIGDRIVEGAFTKSLGVWKASGDPIPVVWSHMWEDPDAHIGKILDAEERDEGLWVKGQLDVADPFASKVFRLMKERRVKEFSFAYDIPEGGEKRAEDGANDLVELELIEVGPTLKGMNPATQLLAAKAAKGSLGVSSGPSSTVDEAWDGPANEANLSTDAGAATYRQAYAWVDSDGDPDVKSSYKFIHHQVSDEGRVGAANVRGCIAGIAVLNGGRGGASIPDSDRTGVYNHLAAHIRAADMEPAPLKSREDFGVKAGRVLSAKNESDLRQAADLITNVLKQLEKPEDPKAESQEPTRAIGRSKDHLTLLLELEELEAS